MPTETPWVFVFGAVFLAALVQSTTGIGFGLIAMPFLLIALSGSAAVQITIFLSLVMSIVLCVRTCHDCDAKLLRTLLLGCIVGLPVGLAVSRSIDSVGLRLLASAVVLLFAVSVAWRPLRTNRVSNTRRRLPLLFGASILGGAMGVCLAMPGPAVIGPLRERCNSDQSVRATLFAYLVLAYGAACGIQLRFTDVSAQAVWTSLILLPAMLIGVFAGHALAPRLSPRQNRISVLLILFTTGVSLFMTTIYKVLS
jgi:uncharacterized membrane protein YfcA